VTNNTEFDYVVDVSNRALRGPEYLRIADQGDILTEALYPKYEALEMSNAQHVFDLASGAGELILRLAGKFPNVQFTGIDALPEAVTYTNADASTQNRKNVHFRHGNILEPLNITSNSGDIVLSRFVAGVVPRSYWQNFVQECYRITRPGGHVMLVEPEFVVAVECPAFDFMVRAMANAFYEFGKGFSRVSIGLSPMLGKFLQDAGYINIQREVCLIDCSSDTLYHERIVNDYINATKHMRKSKPIQQLLMQQMTESEMDSKIEMMEQELRNKPRLDWYVVVARGQKSKA
jgi:SAM-dependent methyltransferase